MCRHTGGDNRAINYPARDEIKNVFVDLLDKDRDVLSGYDFDNFFLFRTQLLPGTGEKNERAAENRNICL